MLLMLKFFSEGGRKSERKIQYNYYDLTELLKLGKSEYCTHFLP